MKLKICNFTNFVYFEENLHLITKNNQLYYVQNNSFSYPIKITSLKKNRLYLFER